MANVTFVVPIGPHHAAIAERALASVQAQTLPCELVPVYDYDGRGPGWARNRGLEQVGTPFMAFLDADDWLEPQFAERTLLARQKGRYVYCDWYEDERIVAAPDKPWCGGKWHVITSLLPTGWVRTSGGFDETLPGMEDTEFYLRLSTGRHCGQRLAEPLFHYGAGGTRAKTFVASADYQMVKDELDRRYRGHMGCCGDNPVEVPPGEKLVGDVLAVALWGGNHQVFGRATGRAYPRTGNRKLAWVDPRDMLSAPDQWEMVVDDEPTVDAAPMLVTTDAVARAMMPPDAVHVVTYTPQMPGPSTVNGALTVERRPDVARVLKLAEGKFNR
jgi:hypothetical protein